MADDRIQLERAHAELERAVETADDDVRDPLEETAGSFGDFVSADREPDHAVFDDHLNALRQARERADDETGERIERALEYAEDYRQEIGGN